MWLWFGSKEVLLQIQSINQLRMSVLPLQTVISFTFDIFDA